MAGKLAKLHSVKVNVFITGFKQKKIKTMLNGYRTVLLTSHFSSQHETSLKLTKQLQLNA